MSKTIQLACDRCTQGVMDQGNDHLWGRCRCACHVITIDCDLCAGVGMLSQERYCVRCEGRGTIEVAA